MTPTRGVENNSGRVSSNNAVLLMHGFPYAPQAFAEVAPELAVSGCRVIVPYLRGYGPTRFLSAATMRSG